MRAYMAHPDQRIAFLEKRMCIISRPAFRAALVVFRRRRRGFATRKSMLMKGIHSSFSASGGVSFFGSGERFPTGPVMANMILSSVTEHRGKTSLEHVQQVQSSFSPSIRQSIFLSDMEKQRFCSFIAAPPLLFSHVYER